MRLFFIVYFILAGLVVADTHYVSTSGANNSPYTNSWADAATNIQWAVNAAAVNDTVLVSNGTYILTNTLTVATAITLVSVNGRDYTTMNLSWGSNIYIYLSTTGTIDGFTIANGCTTSAAACGGGALVVAGTIQNCTVVSNRLTATVNGTYGGGIYCGGGGLVSNCIVAYNSSGYSGGGVYLSAATIRNCVISSNNAASTDGSAGGGGVFMAGVSRITDCVVSNNASSGFAAGLAFSDGSGKYASNCVITDNLGPSPGFRIGSANTAEYCVVRNNGGLRNQAGACEVYGVLRNSVIRDNNKTAYNPNAYGLHVRSDSLVENCVISNNYGQNYGTGVRMQSGGTLRNCLIIANTNSSANSAAGVYNGGASIAIVENCTIAGNARGMSFSAADGAATNLVINTIVHSNTVDITDGGGVNWFTNCNVGATVAGANNINTNPAWVDPGNYNFRLTTGSKCVNAGINQSWMTGAVDLDGRTRIRYGTVDMGAYELIHSGTIYSFH